MRAYAGRQREFGFRMVANCVLTPETLPGARQVLDFAREHRLLVSFSPQAVNNWPRYELLVSDEYKALVREHQRFNRYRILQAQTLLRTTTQSIGAIARLVGFKDQAYFSRVFSKVMGKPPQAYRDS